MFYAYVIKSLQHKFYYKGHCENLEVRINSGMTTSILRYIPFKIDYYEEFDTREEAVSSEKYLKVLPAEDF